MGGVNHQSSFDATVTPTVNKQPVFSALAVSATLSAMAVSPHVLTPQLNFSVEPLRSVTQFVSENAKGNVRYQEKAGEDERKPLEVKVSTFTKDELNAKLAQNKAEVDSVSASMKTEMANFRTAYVESFAEISKTLSRIESKADATEKRLTQAQWIVSLVISVCAVTLSAVIFFSNKNSNHAQQQPATTQWSGQSESKQTPPKDMPEPQKSNP